MDSIYSAVHGISWSALAMGALPLFVWLVWSWNEVRFLIPLKLRSDGANIPPGNMGLPFFGEMLSFLWYFKIVRRPDDFIMSKRKRLASCGLKAQGTPTHTPDVQCTKVVDNETKVDDSGGLSSCTNVGGGIGLKDYVQRKHAE